MKWNDLKPWFIQFLNENDNQPVPLYTVCMISRDIRKSIRVSIDEMDAIQEEVKNGDRRRGWIAKNRIRQLLEIKEAIENGQHDIENQRNFNKL